MRSPRGQRLLDEVLPVEGPADTREFDLLILDEAHHVAPAAPKARAAGSASAATVAASARMSARVASASRPGGSRP